MIDCLTYKARNFSEHLNCVIHIILFSYTSLELLFTREYVPQHGCVIITKISHNNSLKSLKRKLLSDKWNKIWAGSSKIKRCWFLLQLYTLGVFPRLIPANLKQKSSWRRWTTCGWERRQNFTCCHMGATTKPWQTLIHFVLNHIQIWNAT